MAVTTETEIQNSALIKLGAERIISANDANNRARLVKERWPKVRDALLRAHPWNFATQYVQLAAITPKPPEIYDFQFVFQLPTDCIRVWGTNLGEHERWEEISLHRLACDFSAVTIKYGMRVTDVTRYDDTFCEVAAWALAYDIAYALTNKEDIVKLAKDGLREALRDARLYDAQSGGSTQVVIADDWLNSRRY